MFGRFYVVCTMCSMSRCFVIGKVTAYIPTYRQCRSMVKTSTKLKGSKSIEREMERCNIWRHLLDMMQVKICGWILRSWSMLTSCSSSIGVVQGCSTTECLAWTSAVASEYLRYMSTLFTWSVRNCSSCHEANDLFCYKGLLVETLFAIRS